MVEITREKLHAYMDDALGEVEMAEVEKALRQSEELRGELERVRDERGRGEHSLGGVWRRQRLTCPTREQLGGYLLRALDPRLAAYIDFHLKTIECPSCLANLDDLRSLQESDGRQARARQKRIFESSRGLLGDSSRPGG